MRGPYIKCARRSLYSEKVSRYSSSSSRSSAAAAAARGRSGSARPGIRLTPRCPPQRTSSLIGRCGASRPSPPGGLRPALTLPRGRTGSSGALTGSPYVFGIHRVRHRKQSGDVQGLRGDHRSDRGSVSWSEARFLGSGPARWISWPPRTWWHAGRTAGSTLRRNS